MFVLPQWLQERGLDSFRMCIRNMLCVSTIANDGNRPVFSEATICILPSKVVYGQLLLVLPKTCNCQTMALGTFRIYISKPHVLLQLLATTGAARLAPRWRVLFGGFDCNSTRPRLFLMCMLLYNYANAVGTFRIDIRKPHVVLPLLATMGAARLAQRRIVYDHFGYLN
jgi:hypothetical protein